MNIVEIYNDILTLKPGDYICLYDVVNPGDINSAYRGNNVGEVYKIYKIQKCSYDDYDLNDVAHIPQCRNCRTNRNVVHLEDPNNEEQTICGCDFKMKTVGGIDVGYIIQQMERRK